MYVAGMDMGYYMSKLLILDQDGKEMVREKENSGVLYGDTAKKLLERGCAKLGIRPEELGRVVLTGIGSKSVDQDAKVVTDVTCQSTACRKLVPGCHTVVDVGGSLTKAVSYTHLDVYKRQGQDGTGDRVAGALPAESRRTGASGGSGVPDR